MCARKVFYIFSKSSDGNQFCAVRQDQLIPAMLDGVHWEYAGCIDISRGKPSSFDVEDAQEATRCQGIYFYRREFAFQLGNLVLVAA
jgi:hypothetical protein